MVITRIDVIINGIFLWYQEQPFPTLNVTRPNPEFFRDLVMEIWTKTCAYSPV